MELVKIGVIHSPYKERGDAPKQGFLSENTVKIEIFPEYADCMKDLNLRREIIVIYWADRADRSVHQTVTPHGPEVRGVFACRSPARPNPILLCEAELIDIEDNILTVKGVEALDGSPLLDIKPQISREHRANG